MTEHVVARGRIKVDARKALDKLRDHMLVDPHLWVCEVARVAIALGAKRLAVDWNSDDLILDFDGRGLAPDAIAHARDHVLTPLDGAEGDALRALGIGIGAALSLDPAFVDVLRIGTEGASTTRVRFERGYVEEAGTPPVPTAVATPRGVAPGTTLRVHARKRRGLGSIGRALTSERPPEIALLEQAIDAPGFALFLRGEPALRPTRGPLLTVDLDVPGTTRAHLEVLSSGGAGYPMLEYCEHGVRLASYVLVGCWGLARMSGTLPVRVVVDAPRLPTNASRSQIRDDAELTRRVRAHTTPAFAIAVAALREPSAIAKTRVGHVVTVLAETAALVNGLGAIAAEVARAHRAGVDLPPEALALLDVPVMYDALGQPLALSALRGGTPENPLRIYEGAEPAPAALAPWLAGTVWLRGLPAERALDGLETASARDLVSAAKAASERRERALAHAASPPIVATSSSTLYKVSFRVTEGELAGLHGEIAVAARTPGRLSTARLFVDERALETLTVTGARLPIDFALAWPAGIVARFQYDAVERNESLGRALLFARRVAATAIAAHEPDPDTLRTAIAMWSEATKVLGDGAELAALSDAAVWRTNDGRLVSLRAITAYAERTGAVCYARTKTSAPDGRIVLAMTDLQAVRAMLPESTLFVPYDIALAHEHALPEPAPAISVAIHLGALSGFVTPGQGLLRVYHAGFPIRNERRPSRNGPVDVILVDRDAVPQPDFEGAVWSTPVIGLDTNEDALLEAVLEACEREVIDHVTMWSYLETSWKAVAERNEQPALAARIAEIPARRERARLAQLAATVLARAPIDLAQRIPEGAARGSYSAPKKGAVVVTLSRGYPPPAELLFKGHPLGATRVGRLPVAAYVDVVDEQLVEEWSRLSAEGLAWAEGALVDASLALAAALVAGAGFADDGEALHLLLALYIESPVRADNVFKTVRWPTVQGGTHQVGESASLRWGANRYEPWRAEADASPYDAPALHLPASSLGELRRKVLSAAGMTLTDHTEPIARLQAIRAKGKRGSPPRLDGTPAHPLLRRRFGELGATWIEGEIELIESGADEITFVDAEGVREPVSLGFGCPVRAVYRADVNTFATVARELTLAAEQLVRGLASDLPAVPSFVRDRVRALICAEVGRNGRASAEDESRAAFKTTNEKWHSLAAIRKWEQPLHFTTDPPPFPPAVKVLRLAPGEATSLAAIFELQDDTAELRAIARGNERRAAPPRTRIALDDTMRAQCMFVIAVDEEGVRGEIGLLHPTHATARRIELFTTMRLLCHIADPEGWPIVAVLEDGALTPNVAFDGLLDAKDHTTRIHRLVRRLLGASVSGLLPAPKNTLGVVRLPSPFLVRSVSGPARTVVALGVFWLTKDWPERPGIHVEAVGLVDKDRIPLTTRTAVSHSVVVPVAGRVWITADAAGLSRALEDVMAWVSVRLAAHVRAASSTLKSIEAYRWDLALLGVLDEPGTDPIAELATDRPDPELMRVAARRAPHLIDAAGGDPAPAPAPFVAAPVVVIPEAVETPKPAESFFGGLVRRVVQRVAPEARATVDSPLTAAIGAALDAMALTGDPVADVRETRRGRPVVYERSTRLVLINAAHPVVKAHAARPTGVLFLVLAALSEINRELVEVTDAEEVAKVLDLLRANG